MILRHLLSSLFSWVVLPTQAEYFLPVLGDQSGQQIKKFIKWDRPGLYYTGLGFWLNALSRAIRTVVSIEVRFLRLRPSVSAALKELQYSPPEELLFMELSASSNHLASKGFSLHMFLKDKFKASKREMVVWEKSFPYILPMAKPTSP